MEEIGKFEKIICKYQSEFKCEQFIVTGSYALYRMGLIEKQTVNDIDIILYSPTEDAKEIIANYASKYPPSSQTVNDITPKKVYDYSCFISPDMDKCLKIDIFLAKNAQANSELLMTPEGFFITNSAQIFQSKRKMGRMKDYISLYRIREKIMTDTEFRVGLLGAPL
jgi:hypothetical protein